MHDVDARPELALSMAEGECRDGIVATYYFRAMHFDSHADVIKVIASLGHKVGYHYESLVACRGDRAAAYDDFCRNLGRLRRLAEVRTACAHGSPASRWNSQDLFGAAPYGAKSYDIHALGIDYEPMMDTDFSRTLYLTDTGRRWDGYRVSVRDKVPAYQRKWQRDGLAFHSTDDIIAALAEPRHPIHTVALLVNTHPQRWVPFGADWMLEAVWQSTKNIAKWVMVKAKY